MKRLAAGFLLALVVLAGCGGGEDRLTKEEYQAEVRRIGSTLGETLGGLNTSAGALGPQVADVQANLRTTADDLDELAPPEEIESAHDKLVEGINGFADELDDLKAAVEAEDEDAIRRFEDTFTGSASVQKIREASEELQEKGYALE